MTDNQETLEPGAGRDEAGAEPVVASDFPVLYAQQVMVGASFYDFSLVFLQESFKGCLPVANVTLPPAAAKKLARVLGEYVASYEQELGEIRMPPEGEEEDVPCTSES